jgi:hypothetical protein
MIEIVNVGPFDDPDPMGLRNYEVRLNGKVYSKFQHSRADGLAKCLIAAAESVEQAKDAEVNRLVHVFDTAMAKTPALFGRHQPLRPLPFVSIVREKHYKRRPTAFEVAYRPGDYDAD